MSGGMEIFDSARVQLRRGINLVEASAGTGKTYAIAMLVLRLVTEQAIPIDRLLVVTFTKAATSELRERIRRRLAEARDLLRNPAVEADQTLRDWAAGITDRSVALERLAAALCDIDCAAIFTIHGFCQRMLQEQALECSQLFQVELIPDTTLIRTQVVNDFWRQAMYDLDAMTCSLLLQQFPSPVHLAETVKGIHGGICAVEPQTRPLAEISSRLTRMYHQLQAWWSSQSNTLHRLFADAIAAGLFKKELAEGFSPWWRQLTSFFDGDGRVVPDCTWLGRGGLLEMLNGQKLRGDEKKRAFLQAWPLADPLSEDWQAAATELRLALRTALAERLRTEVEDRLRGQGGMSYNDLILSLAGALREEGGERLQAVLGERYAAALIDEFQDTDADQWQIFSALFGAGGHFLYLIGDPKQAIYRFRGADIHSYFAARQRADHLLTLQRNFRSHPHLVAAVNRLFDGERPFVFDDGIMPYHPVDPARTADDGELMQEGRILEPLLYCHLPAPVEGRWSSNKAGEQIRRFVAREIGSLLSPATTARIREKGIERPLQPGDIAILVRSNSQAASYQQTLVERGIPAVVASRQSVFATVECEDILRILKAVHEPGDLILQKAAMTCSWFDLDGSQLQAIWLDDEQFDSWHLRFQFYAQLWQERGFLAMMSTLLRQEQVFVNLAARKMADRKISNISQLLEVIQEAVAAENLGPVQTLQWLQAMRTSGEKVEEFELRLETDEAAVQVVTMHSAKGLEYPLVFCPLLWYRRNSISTEQNLLIFHDEDKNLRADLGSDDFGHRRLEAEQDELSEDLRLLYVALTRAKLRCYVAWADVKKHAPVEDAFQSALGMRLFPEGLCDEGAQISRLQALAGDDGVGWRVIDADEEDSEPSLAADRDVPALSCRQSIRGPLQNVWQMSSYSALASQSKHEEEKPGPEIEPPLSSAVTDEDLIEVRGLPAGAHFGNVVHDLFESVSFAELAGGAELTDRLAPLKKRYGLELESERLSFLLRNAASSILLPAGGEGQSFSLAMLDERRILREMPFYFHLGLTSTAQMNEILMPDPTCLPLSHRELQGYLTGFVDLVCEHAGRFYIIDYKTNQLGERRVDYSPSALLAAMRAHNYGLQYWLYTLTLHRYLGDVLPGYDYDRDFGGVLYLFVRGMQPILPGSGVFHARPDFARLQELDRCLGGGI